MLKIKTLLLIFALLIPTVTHADCTSFPIEVFVNGIDPRFNLSYESAVQDLQNSIDNVNSSIGRYLIKQSSNGIPVTFEWNDTSAKAQAIGQIENALNKLQEDINTLKYQVATMTARNLPQTEINAVINQLNQQINNYNEDAAAISNFRAQTTNEALGSFSRISTYAYIKVFGFDSKANLIHVLTHELGHVLGLDHNNGYVMDAHTNQYFEFSSLDSDKIRAEYDLVCKP